ncbi:MAG TPA: P-loop NTPase [bacterium]|nr:P-loop NTPase [bacterium]HPN30171.1 P-loop NTPase [bacterium]
MKIAIASGKGGTGKTTITVMLAAALSQARYLTILDCDVETPNVCSLLKHKINLSKGVSIPVTKVIEDKCVKCGLCVKQCKFNALALVKDQILFFEELCKNCGVCAYLCPSKAIIEYSKNIGKIEISESANNISIFTGIINNGEQKSGKIIWNLKNSRTSNNIQIIDCPAGTGTELFQCVHNSDYCILVSEPTILGLNDLKLAIKVLIKTGVPFGIIINKITDKNNLIKIYADSNGIEILSEIYWDKDFFNINNNKNILNFKKSIFAEMKNLYKKISGKFK